MAKAKGRTAGADDDDQELETEDLDLGDIADLEELDFAEAKWRLHRGHPDGVRRGPYLEGGTGPLTYDAIFESFGGGDFVLRVWYPDGRKARYRFQLEGAPVVKQHKKLPPAAGSELAGESGESSIRDLGVELQRLRIQAQIGELRDELRLSRRPAESDGINDLAKVLELARSISQPTNPQALLDFSMNLVDRVEKRMRVAEGGGSSMADVIRDVAPQVLNVLGEIFQARPRPDGTRPPLARVVDPLEGVVMKLLAHANRKKLSASDLAEDADVLLTDEELESLKGAELEHVTTVLSGASDQDARLRDPRVAEYVRAFLVELKKPAEPNEADPPPS